MQFTNYQIFSGDKIVFTNTNTSCFAEFTNTGFDDKARGFAPDRYMEIYFLESNTILTQEVINFWTEELTKMGLPISYEHRDLTKSKDQLPVRFVKGKTHVWKIDFNDYKSKAQLILCLHLMRYMYEIEMPKIINEVYKLKQKNPEESTWELFQFVSMFKGSSGHIFLYQGSLNKILDNSYLEQQINLWSKLVKILGNELSNFKSTLVVTSDPNFKPLYNWQLPPAMMINKIPGLTINTPLKEYKEKLKNLLENGTTSVEKQV